MPDFSSIDAALAAGGPQRAADTLVESLRDGREYDRLFDALLMRTRLGMGLSAVRPAGFDDVPADKLTAFQDAYIAAAREIGRLHLEAGDIPRAWVYFRTLREPEPVAAALDAVDPASLDPEAAGALVRVALDEEANRLAGLRILLATHGTCNTVSMTDQVLPLLTPDERRAAAAMLVRDVYASLAEALRRDVASQPRYAEPDGPPREAGVAGLIEGRPGLFDDGNYHVDVSHLHSVVRFARALTPDDPELAQAVELADYGSRLADQFRYPADPPFDDYYPASVAYFQAVAGGAEREAGLTYFRDRLAAETDPRDRRLAAYVLVDLLLRLGRTEEAAEVAAEHLPGLEEAGGLSFAGLCRRAGRLDLLVAAARDAGDVVGYAAARIEAADRGTGGG